MSAWQALLRYPVRLDTEFILLFKRSLRDIGESCLLHGLCTGSMLQCE
jgi:hypothetical protein